MCVPFRSSSVSVCCHSSTTFCGEGSTVEIDGLLARDCSKLPCSQGYVLGNEHPLVYLSWNEQSTAAIYMPGSGVWGGGDDQNLNRQIFPTFHQTVKNFTSFCSDTSARSHRSVVASAALLPSVRLEAELERSAPQAVARMRSARRSLINVGAVQWLRNDVLQTDEGRLKFYASII